MGEAQTGPNDGLGRLAAREARRPRKEGVGRASLTRTFDGRDRSRLARRDGPDSPRPRAPSPAHLRWAQRPDSLWGQWSNGASRPLGGKENGGFERGKSPLPGRPHPRRSKGWVVPGGNGPGRCGGGAAIRGGARNGNGNRSQGIESPRSSNARATPFPILASTHCSEEPRLSRPPHRPGPRPTYSELTPSDQATPKAAPSQAKAKPARRREAFHKSTTRP